MLTLDAPAAIQAMPRLLEGETPPIRTALDEMKRVLEPLSAAARGQMNYLRGGRAPRDAHAPPRAAPQGRGARSARRQGRRGRSAIEPAGRPRSRPPGAPAP